MMSGVQKVLQDANKWHPFPDPDHMYFISVDVFQSGSNCFARSTSMQTAV